MSKARVRFPGVPDAGVPGDRTPAEGLTMLSVRLFSIDKWKFPRISEAGVSDVGRKSPVRRCANWID
jgi:hypothetical protein